MDEEFQSEYGSHSIKKTRGRNGKNLKCQNQLLESFSPVTANFVKCTGDERLTDFLVNQKARELNKNFVDSRFSESEKFAVSGLFSFGKISNVKILVSSKHWILDGVLV